MTEPEFRIAGHVLKGRKLDTAKCGMCQLPLRPLEIVVQPNGQAWFHVFCVQNRETERDG